VKTAEIKVDYVDHMGDDLAVVNAARVSFDKESAWEYEDVKAIGYENAYNEVRRLSDSDAKLIKYLAEHNHWSPFAHAIVKLRVKAPIFVARQLVKHQVGASWNEVSRRYVDSEPEFYFPDVWRGRPTNGAKQGSSGVVDTVRWRLGPLQENFHEAPIGPEVKASVSGLLKLYEVLIYSGVAPEQARMVLPQNMMTEWIWTGSLVFWARVCRERLAPGAQKEAGDVARLISEAVQPLFPVSWAALSGKDCLPEAVAV